MMKKTRLVFFKFFDDGDDEFPKECHSAFKDLKVDNIELGLDH